MRLRYRPRLRARTLAIAGLCLIAQALALAHLFVVRHARCAEHGEVIHVAAAADASASGARQAPGSASAAPAPGEPGDPDGHDHCQWLSELRDHARRAPQIDLVPPPLDLERAALPPAPPDRARPLYRLAPKISPPALAT